MRKEFWSGVAQGVMSRSRRLMHSRGATWLGAAMAVVLLFVLGTLIYRQRDLILHYLLRADPRLLIAVFVWYTLNMLAYIAGWALIMRVLGDNSPFIEHLRIYYTANAAKRVPGSLWHIGGRAVLYERLGVAPRLVVIASGIEAVLTTVTGALLSVPVLIFVVPGLRWLWLMLSAVVVLVLLNPSVLRQALARTVEGWTATRVPIRYIYGVIGMFGIGWVFGGCLVLNIIRIFQPLAWAQLPGIVGSWTTAGTLSTLMLFLPSNLGVTELSLTVMLSRFVPMAVAVLTAVSTRLLVTLLDLLCSGCAILLNKAFRQS